jgi:hypothetical protein
MPLMPAPITATRRTLGEAVIFSPLDVQVFRLISALVPIFYTDVVLLIHEDIAIGAAIWRENSITRRKNKVHIMLEYLRQSEVLAGGRGGGQELAYYRGSSHVV